MHQAESTWLKVRNDSQSADGRGLPIRGPQRPSPYADGVRGGAWWSLKVRCLCFPSVQAAVLSL